MIEAGYYSSALPLDRRAYISRSKIALALEGMEYYFALYGEGKKRPETEAMIRGRRLHHAVLEHDQFRRNRVLSKYENIRSGEGLKWATQKLREYPNAVIQSLAESHETDRIIDRVMSHRMAGPLISRALKEKHGYAICPRTGLVLYSRPDIKTAEGEIAELKFVRSVDEFQFARQQYSERWFMQLAFYNFVDGLITGQRLFGNCFYVAVEWEYPHKLAVLTLDPTFEKMGDILWNEGLDKIKTCLELDPHMKNFEFWRMESNQAREIRPEYWMLNNDERFKTLIQLGA